MRKPLRLNRPAHRLGATFRYLPGHGTALVLLSGGGPPEPAPESAQAAGKPGTTRRGGDA